jgi:hypothetical protein
MGSASSFRSSGIQLLSGLFLLTLSSCFPCADMDCGNGVCSQGVCECYDGYYGSECQYATGGAGYDCNSGNCSYVLGNADYATITDCQNACGSSCDYNVYSGGGSCSDPANFPVSASLCCSPSYPFYCSETGMCYTSCAAADAACSSATVVTGSTSGGGAGYDCISGSCTYVSANGDYATLSACQSACAPSCSYSVFTGGGTCNDPANFPVSTTWCCSSTYPYYCPETGLCYSSCAAADAACSSAGVVTGSGFGGAAGYVCSNGNCSYVSSGASYSSLSACQSSCGGNNFSLDDHWLAPSGTGIIISGQNGVFYAFSSNWQLFVNNGTVNVGTLKVRYITQINSTTWSCQALFLQLIDGDPITVEWSVDGTLTMSSDGTSITASATSPFSNGIGSETYYRQ